MIASLVGISQVVPGRITRAALVQVLVAGDCGFWCCASLVQSAQAEADQEWLLSCLGWLALSCT